MPAGQAPSPRSRPRLRDGAQPDTVIPSEFDGLRSLTWNRDPDRAIPAAEAFALYERNWRHVDVEALTIAERALIAALIARFGHGVMLAGWTPAAGLGGKAMVDREYLRPEHGAIARVLRRLRSDVLLESRCWFAGGTAIVMTHGEYRLSLDIAFLCSSVEGYRALRQAMTARGVAALFDGPVTALRDVRCDQYGLRTAIAVEGRPVKVEIVREARIDIAGAFDERLGCPLLSLDDLFAEKLLANSDRGRDPATHYRDALDLGIMVLGHGGRVPDAAGTKAVAAYGWDAWRDAERTVTSLVARPKDLVRAADALGMDRDLARTAILALGEAIPKAGPGSEA